MSSTFCLACHLLFIFLLEKVLEPDSLFFVGQDPLGVHPIRNAFVQATSLAKLFALREDFAFAV